MCILMLTFINGQEDRKKTCRKKQHIRIDDRKERSDLICGKAAVGGNYNSTHDSKDYDGR